jgi:hypothetical protein
LDTRGYVFHINDLPTMTASEKRLILQKQNRKTRNVGIIWDDGNFLECSVLHSNSILLKPSIPLKLEDFVLDNSSFYIPKLEFQLNPGEQYFHILLHEIGHFKKVHLERVKQIIPAEYIRIIRRLEKEFPDDAYEQYIMEWRVLSNRGKVKS